jgi:hypothetical protein
MLEDLTLTQLRKIIRDYNLHTSIKSEKGKPIRTLSKEELIKHIQSKMTLINGELVIDPNLNKISLSKITAKKPRQPKQPRKKKERKISKYNSIWNYLIEKMNENNELESLLLSDKVLPLTNQLLSQTKQTTMNTKNWENSIEKQIYDILLNFGNQLNKNEKEAKSLIEDNKIKISKEQNKILRNKKLTDIEKEEKYTKLQKPLLEKEEEVEKLRKSWRLISRVIDFIAFAEKKY